MTIDDTNYVVITTVFAMKLKIKIKLFSARDPSSGMYEDQHIYVLV